MGKKSISTGQPFLYRYNKKIHEASAVLFLDGDYFRYQVTTETNIRVTISPSSFPGSRNSIVWIQALKLYQIALPPDLIQALGEGIEAMG